MAKYLQNADLGISAWATLSGGDDGALWWSREIGYSKVRDKWAIALRASKGHHGAPEHDSEETWLFGEAPRWMRIEAVGKIPDLLEALLKQVEDTTKKIKNKTHLVHQLAAIVITEQPDEDCVHDRTRP